ncbi:MAG: sterol desaturase family protein [Solirubrobacteraceae bacterium]|nr:sterol desaturase family protein [Solirubrobacteraceae bacterium]
MVNLIVAAIPFFVLLVAMELVLLRTVGRHHHDDAPATDRPADAHRRRRLRWMTAPYRSPRARDDDDRRPLGYDARDAATSMTLGLGKVIGDLGWKLVVAVAYAGLFVLSPISLPTDAWWTWVLLFFADDLSYYWYHRLAHRVRLFWANHVVHHSSERFNLSTALRQTVTGWDTIIYWAWMPLVGFEPWMIFLAQSWSLLYQFWIHTELIERLPRWFEAVFNTPSHHRVHHGSQEQYLDKNYAGILIVWDRLLGTFEPEGERVRYGLTTNIGTYHPVRAAFHEYGALWRDLRSARTVRDRIGYLVGPPGWAPATPVASERPGDADAPAPGAHHPAT